MSGGGPVAWSLIAAADRNGLIGNVDAHGARLPWRLPEDLAYFKRVTLGKPVVMGRRTFESIGKALPGRLNVVLTRRGGFDAPGIRLVADRAAAEAVVRSALDAANAPSREAFVIGGAEVFAQFMPLASRLYLTEIDHLFDGNCRVAEFAPGRLSSNPGWRQISRETHRSADDYNYSFVVRERVAHAATH